MLAEVPHTGLTGVEVAEAGEAGANHFPAAGRAAGGQVAAPAGSLCDCRITLSDLQLNYNVIYSIPPPLDNAII